MYKYLFFILSLIFVGCSSNKNNNSENSEEKNSKNALLDTVLFIDDIPVLTNEFLKEMESKKQTQINYYKSRYKVNYFDGFWDTIIENETPMERLKDGVIFDIQRKLAERLLMKKYGVINDVSENAINAELDSLNRMAKSNAINNKIRKYTEQDVYLIRRDKLKDRLIEEGIINVDDETLKKYFKSIKSRIKNISYSKDKKMIEFNYVNNEYQSILSKKNDEVRLKLNYEVFKDLRIK